MVPVPFTLGGTVEGWWQSSYTNLLAGNKVSSVSDLSGNGRHFTEATGAKQPTLVSGVQNGYPALRFAGGQRMQCDAICLPFTGVGLEIAVLAAYTWLAPNGYRAIFSMANAIDGSYLDSSVDGNGDIMTLDIYNDVTFAQANALKSPGTSAVVVGGSYALGSIAGYSNGSAAAPNPAVVDPLTFSTGRMGCVTSQGFEFGNLRGDIFELIVLSGVGIDIVKGVNYLASKYAI